jgi:hypothetical protein
MMPSLLPFAAFLAGFSTSLETNGVGISNPQQEAASDA